MGQKTVEGGHRNQRMLVIKESNLGMVFEWNHNANFNNEMIIFERAFLVICACNRRV
jgi:hypothetical protein